MSRLHQQRLSGVDMPYAGIERTDAYFGVPHALTSCIRAEANVHRILRKIGEFRLNAQDVLLSMLPAMRGEKIDVSESRVREAVEKIHASERYRSAFIEPIVRLLPLEYALEMNRLIEMEMEGSVG